MMIEKLPITISTINKSHSMVIINSTRDVVSWLNHLGIMEEDTLKDINYLKSTS